MKRRTFQRIAFAVLFILAILQAVTTTPSAGADPKQVKVKSVDIVITTVDPQDFLNAFYAYQWGKVAVCETGGNWQMHGSIFSGALGIRNNVWLAYGGGEFAPHAGLAEPKEQITIARRIEAQAGTPNYVPDQKGCSGGW